MEHCWVCFQRYQGHVDACSWTRQVVSSDHGHKPLEDGATESCMEEKFTKYRQEVEPVAYQIVDGMDLF
jgi:hypothetical protein